MKNLFFRFIRKISPIVLFIFIGSWTYLHWEKFFSVGKEKQIVTVIENSNQCDLQKSFCVGVITEKDKIQLDIMPKPIIANRKQKAILRIQGSTLIPEELDFTGVAMEMGFNRPIFKKTGEYEYTADFILEACALGEIQWKALVLFQPTNGRQFGIPFYFRVGPTKK